MPDGMGPLEREIADLLEGPADPETVTLSTDPETADALFSVLTERERAWRDEQVARAVRRLARALSLSSATRRRMLRCRVLAAALSDRRPLVAKGGDA